MPRISRKRSRKNDVDAMFAAAFASVPVDEESEATNTVAAAAAAATITPCSVQEGSDSIAANLSERGAGGLSYPFAASLGEKQERWVVQGNAA